MIRFANQLAKTRVHIGGAGRIGTAVALALHSAGIGEISCNDPQKFDVEQLDHCPFSRRSDVGRPKVYVLERFFEGRVGFAFLPFVGPNESPDLEPYLKRADLIISCANSLPARLHLERAAVRLGKPCLQASAEDGRQALAGMISLWAPKADCSCFGCLVPDRGPRFRRGEILFPTVTRVIANLTAHLAVSMLAQDAAELARRSNVFTIDLQAFVIDGLSVRRRPGCRVCRASGTEGAS